MPVATRKICTILQHRNTLRAIHNCQHLNECTKYTLSHTTPPQKVYTSTFFKWIICHENDLKKIG